MPKITLTENESGLQFTVETALIDGLSKYGDKTTVDINGDIAIVREPLIEICRKVVLAYGKSAFYAAES